MRCDSLTTAFMLGVLAMTLASAGPVAAQSAPVERTVTAPTRLDWAFAAQGFGAGSDKLPAGYDSTKQRYQLYVPKQASAGKPAPLVLFISAGGQPMGWNAWKAVCAKEGVFFCSPFAAGNNVPPGQRTRIILDVLDDVRRHHRIDPQQTYLTGFSGGARMACALAFALPEYFGGVAPFCGTNPPTGPTYLRHRLQDRLSVALVTGETDFNRKENEEYMAPWLAELGIRTKLWVVPKMGHEIPRPEVVRTIYDWLKADLPRRRSDAKAHPELTVAPDEGPAGGELARRLAAAGQQELKQPERTWRGIALLQGAALRGARTESGTQARQQLKDVLSDEALLGRIAEQGAKDEQLAVSSQARALERFGLTNKAVEAWQLLAKNYAGTPIGQNAEAEIRRLQGDAKLPPAYLGLGLTDTAIDQLAPQGPAAKAGLKLGDVLTKVGDRKITSADDLRAAMTTLKPGDRVRVEVMRDGRRVMVMLQVGRRPTPKAPK